MRKTAASSQMWLLSLIAALAATAMASAPVPAATPLVPSLAIAPPAARQRDLLAEAGQDHFWIARVMKDTPDNSSQTMIVFRSRWSNNADWTALPLIPDRVESMACSNGELLIVLANGQWEIAD